jgi:hypothetical protein
MFILLLRLSIIIVFSCVEIQSQTDQNPYYLYERIEWTEEKGEDLICTYSPNRV